MANEERKVVIVDNHSDWGESLAEFFKLTSENQPIQALKLIIEVVDSSGFTAEQMLTEVLKHEPQLVITGVRNSDNSDENDGTGIVLASDLAREGIRAFVVSSTRYESVVKSLGLSFFDQRGGLSELRRAVFNVLTIDLAGKTMRQDPE